MVVKRAAGRGANAGRGFCRRWDKAHCRTVLAYLYNRDDGRCGLCAGEMKLQAAHLKGVVPKVFAGFDVRMGDKADPGTHYKSRLHKIDDL